MRNILPLLSIPVNRAFPGIHIKANRLRVLQFWQPNCTYDPTLRSFAQGEEERT
jgi:hypothetical protein